MDNFQGQLLEPTMVKRYMSMFTTRENTTSPCTGIDFLTIGTLMLFDRKKKSKMCSRSPNFRSKFVLVDIF